MHTRRAIATLLLAVLGATSSAAAGSEPDVPPGWLDETLANGLRVSILADPSLPVVATQVWYHVGSADEDAGSRGLAHLFEHLMFGANERYGAEAYSRYFDRHGGYENAYTSSDETVYVSAIVPEAFGPVLDMEAARMRGLVLDEPNLENEQRIVTEELRLRTQNDPMSRLLVAAQGAVFGTHPYAIAPTGTPEDIAAATVESCRRFYDAWYRPDNAHVVVVGPVDARATLDEIRTRFGDLAAAPIERRKIPALVGWDFPERIVVLREDLPPVETALVGYALPAADSDDHWAVELLVQLLTGGSVDPLREEIVVRRGKAIEAGIESFSFRRGGALVFYAASLPYRRRVTAFRHVSAAIERLSDLAWLTDDTLAAGKRALLRRHYEGGYSAATRAGQIGRAAWWLGDPAIALEGDRRIREVTREQVAVAWRRYVAGARPVRLYVRPEKVPLLVRLFGWIYPWVH